MRKENENFFFEAVPLCLTPLTLPYGSNVFAHVFETHVTTELLLQHTLPSSAQSKCRWVNIDFILTKVGFSPSALHGPHYCVLAILIHPKLLPQPRLFSAKLIMWPNRSCFDCHLITHRLLHNLPVKRRGWLEGGGGVCGGVGARRRPQYPLHQCRQPPQKALMTEDEWL